MGVDDAIKAKIHQIGPGLPVSEAVARGEGEIGFTQVSELLSGQGVDFAGPLPAEVQQMTVWSAGLHVAAPAPDGAKALVRYLTSPAARAVIRRSGMEPR